jgi:hypothetical protein
MRSPVAALSALSLAAAPAIAQAPDAPEPAPEQRRRGLEGEAIGYLAVPVLLVLTIVAGLLVGGGDEEPESP